MSFGLQKVFSHHGGRMIEQWVFDAKSPLVCAAAVADLTGNGTRHAVFGTKDGVVICVDERGKEQWRYGAKTELGGIAGYFVDQERVYSIDAPPIIADIDRDGKQEIIVGTELGTLTCLSHDGKLRWQIETDGSIRASACVADINMDGLQEILIGSGKRLLVLRADGTTLFEYATDSPVESTPAVMPGNKPLIIFGNNAGSLFCITPAQDLVWKAELKDKITAAPAVFSVPEERRVAIGTHGGILHCISEHGEPVWEYKTDGSIYNAAAIGDINDDKQAEIVIGSCDNNVHAVTHDGRRFWTYETDFWVMGTPIIADIDGDGKPEVIVGSFDHNVYILDGKGTYVLDYVPGLSGIVTQAGHYSNILTSDVGEQTGKKLWQFRTPGMIVGCTLLSPTALVVNIKSGQASGIGHTE
jgi:outer membrane protein assembly factor BamB